MLVVPPKFAFTNPLLSTFAIAGFSLLNVKFVGGNSLLFLSILCNCYFHHFDVLLFGLIL